MNYTKWKQKGEKCIAVAVTVLMITTLILAAVPAFTARATSEPTVSITTDPKSDIQAFDDFSMDLDFVHNAYTDSDVTSIDITVTGVPKRASVQAAVQCSVTGSMYRRGKSPIPVWGLLRCSLM